MAAIAAVSALLDRVAELDARRLAVDARPIVADARSILAEAGELAGVPYVGGHSVPSDPGPVAAGRGRRAGHAVPGRA
jgi:hypothetical protein